MASITSMGWFSCPLVRTPMNSWLQAWTQRGLVVSVTQRLYAGDEAGARGSHEEESDHAHGDGGGPKAPQAKEVAHQAEHHPHEPGREVHARAQDREDDTLYAEEQAYEAADPAHEQL